MRRWIMLTAMLTLAATGCGDPDATEPGEGAQAGNGAGASLTRCDEVEPVAAPDESYDDEPVYVANEMPTDEVRAWASEQPGFQQLWIDRDHNGWVTVGFTEDAETRQAEIDERFPDDGVVAVEVAEPRQRLEELQQQVVSELSSVSATSSSVRHGVVTINVGEMTDERLAEVAERFGDEPVCVEGTDPDDAPPEGPQQPDGDGWRLLAAQQDAGATYRTGVATDEDQYEELWEEAGLSGEPEEVDLETEVVLWFGAVYGSGCDDLRLDDVIVDRDEALVHADIVLTDPPPACNDDANPYAFVVAVGRDRLPSDGFALQLGADDPPPGAPEERTYVEADLTAPGSVAEPGDLRQGTREDLGVSEGPRQVDPGDIIEPGFEARFELYVHCGAEWLGELNSTVWRSDEVSDEPGNVPPAWSEVATDEVVELTVELATDPEPTLTAEANGREVVYEPADEPQPECD